VFYSSSSVTSNSLLIVKQKTPSLFEPKESTLIDHLVILSVGNFARKAVGYISSGSKSISCSLD